MLGILTVSMQLMADSTGAINAMREYVVPTVHTLSILAGVASAFFLANGGYMYMTSAGKPESLEHAKRVIKNALLGLVIVLAATTLTAILAHAYGNSAVTGSATLPALQSVPPEHVSNGLIDILIKAVTGLLNNIIQAIAKPVLEALTFFTQSTPLMASNASVFNLWLAMVGIADTLFIVILALLGFHVMGASTFGLDEVNFKHLLPRVGLMFLLLNTSIFIIDGVIEMSNALIHAISLVGGSGSVWDVLTLVVKEAGGQGVAALLIMVAFLIFSVILLVYYVGRLVSLFIGAVLSPLIFLVWLVPGFRDFSETAMKTYIVTVFTLFVHVVILQLAASLFAGMVLASDNGTPDVIMSMVTGLATVIALLKTQGVMMQFSYVSLGPRTMRQLGGQFINGVSYMGAKGRGAVQTVTTRSSKKTTAATTTSSKSSKGRVNTTTYTQPGSKTAASKRNPTGTTYEAPKISSRESTKGKDNGQQA